MSDQKCEDKEAWMETTTREIAAVLRSTDSMADQFAIQVQERLGQPVSHDEILAVMKKMSAKQLSMKKVVAKIRQQRQ
jgi:hypothetical protein